MRQCFGVVIGIGRGEAGIIDGPWFVESTREKADEFEHFVVEELRIADPAWIHIFPIGKVHLAQITTKQVVFDDICEWFEKNRR